MISIALALFASSESAAWKPAEAISSPATWVTANDYPAAALRAGEQGTVAFRFEVKPDGSIGSCDVTTSSGSQVLDDATCSLVRMRARYSPAINASGRPATDYKTLRFTWKLPEDGETDARIEHLFALKPFATSTVFDVTPEGAIENCHTGVEGVDKQVGMRDPCEALKTLPFKSPDARETPRRRTVTYRISMTVQDAQPQAKTGSAPASAVKATDRISTRPN